MNYRRLIQPGGCFFFTVNLVNRQSALLTENIDLLRESVREVKRQHPFDIEAIVVLPEHLHTIWRLPKNDSDYANRWRLIKSAFSRQLPKDEYIRPSRIKKQERGIWQRRYWEHYIRDEKDWIAHINYIHHNPVKHGCVKRMEDWPYSSIHRYIAKKTLPMEVMMQAVEDIETGER